MDTPTPCNGTCGRLLRPGSWPATKAPGTAPHRRGGYCKPCLAALPPELTPAPRKTGAETRSHCVQCGGRMRPHDAKVADHPGTYRHIGGGNCARCLQSGDIEITDPEGIRPSFDEDQTRASLQAWLADRSRRLGYIHHFPVPTADTGQVAA